jgi:hypothetical protein
MVDLDTSHKCVGWYGPKFLVVQVGHDGTQGLMATCTELENFGTNLAFELHMFVQNLFP